MRASFVALGSIGTDMSHSIPSAFCRSRSPSTGRSRVLLFTSHFGKDGIP
jgi:hypothetical protein